MAFTALTPGSSCVSWHQIPALALCQGLWSNRSGWQYDRATGLVSRQQRGIQGRSLWPFCWRSRPPDRVSSTILDEWCKMESTTHRLYKPPLPSEFKPSQMTTPRRGHHDSVRVALYLSEWECLACDDLVWCQWASDNDDQSCATYRVIFSLYGQERNPNGE